MTLQIPELSKRTYKEMEEDMLASIPKLSSEWTNFNPSDPGITIIELLCWIEENVLYKVDRIQEETYINLLRLVAGTSGADDLELLLDNVKQDIEHKKILEFLKDLESGNKKSIDEIKAFALNFMQSRYRAVIEVDFQYLAIEATDSEHYDGAMVKRTIINSYPVQGKVEIVVVSENNNKYETQSSEGILEISLGVGPQDEYSPLVKTVKDYLEVRKLVGTIIDVKSPGFTPINIELEILCKPHVVIDTVMNSVKDGILKLLDPLEGGADGSGWPYNRPLTIYELSHIIEETDGVERAESIVLGDEGMTKMKISGLVRLESLLIKSVNTT